MSKCRNIFFAKQFCSKHFAQYLANLLFITQLWLLFITQDIWHTCGTQTTFSCYGMNLNNTQRLVNRINDSYIRVNGVERNLSAHDHRSIINRIPSNPNLRSIRYVLSSNKTPKEICLLLQEKNPMISQQKVEQCRIVKGTRCRQEFVLINKVKTIKNCEAAGLSETCATKKRNQLVQIQTVLCQKSERFTCNENEEKPKSFNKTKICHPNRLAICQRKPKIVTVTETQRLCGKDFQEMTYRTTKMCITYEHDTDQTLVGEWKCLDLEHLYQRCLTFHAKKQIRSEIAQGGQHSKLECTHTGDFKPQYNYKNHII